MPTPVTASKILGCLDTEYATVEWRVVDRRKFRQESSSFVDDTIDTAVVEFSESAVCDEFPYERTLIIGDARICS